MVLGILLLHHIQTVDSWIVISRTAYLGMTQVVSGKYFHVLKTYSATPWLNETAKSQNNAITQLRESCATQ